jgi:hypothetical protein
VPPKYDLVKIRQAGNAMKYLPWVYKRKRKERHHHLLLQVHCTFCDDALVREKEKNDTTIYYFRSIALSVTMLLGAVPWRSPGGWDGTPEYRCSHLDEMAHLKKLEGFHTVLEGELRLMSAQIIFILSDTSFFYGSKPVEWCMSPFY